ncbi:hypothetical protein YPPY58_2229, partial [Yersinia pestis PY-58]
MLALGVIGGS